MHRSQRSCSPTALVPFRSPMLAAGHSLQLTLLLTLHVGLYLEYPLWLALHPASQHGDQQLLGIAISFPKLGCENFQLLSVCTQKCFLCCVTSSWPRSCASSILLMEAGEAGGFCWDQGVLCGATLVQEPRSPRPVLSVLRTSLLVPSIRWDCGNDSAYVSH